MALEKVLALDSSGVVEKTIVTGAGVDGVVIKQAITLTSGQTTVAVPGGYSAAGVIVFLNGVYLTPAEYTASSSPNIVLAVGAPSTGSILDVLVLVSDGLASLGTAAYANLIASLSDTTAGRVLTAGAHNLGVAPFAKNKIINGDFRVWQRGISLAIPASGAVVYAADRWGILAGGAGVTVAPSYFYNPGHKSMAVFGAAGNTYTNIQQYIESINIESEVGKPFTISFEVLSSNTRTINLYLQTPDTLDTFNGAKTTFASSLAISVPASTVTVITLSGTIPAGGVRGVSVLIECGGLLAGQNVAIANVQLETGSVATPFEHRPYGQELALCQRYYQVVSVRVPAGAENLSISTILPVTPRVTPTIGGGGAGFVATASPSGAYLTYQTAADFNNLTFSAEL